MSYRFKRRESLPDSTQRIVTEQCQRAAADIEATKTDRQTGIHNARKRIKKLRSLLRLIRYGIGKQRYRRENQHLRKLAHRLAGVRDADTLIESFDKLIDNNESLREDSDFREIREHLENNREDVRESQDVSNDASVTAETLRSLPRRISDLRFSQRGYSGLKRGYRRNYKRARKGFHRAYARQSAERFHEWRKRVKDDWYHTRLLRPLWPKAFKTRASTLKSLSQLLGDDHDLHLLTQEMRRQQSELGSSATMVICLARQRQAVLRDEAYTLGRRLYAETADCRSKTLQRLWTAWRSAGQRST